MKKYVVGVKFDYSTLNHKYERFPLESSKADKNKLPHEIVVNVVLSSSGKLLLLRRAKNKRTYPGYLHFPSGHSKVYRGKCEDYENAAKRELKEETGIEPDLTRGYYPHMELFDEKTGHVGISFLHLVENEYVVYNKEVDPEGSGFQTPEKIIKLLDNDDFTEISRKLLNKIFDDFSTQEQLKSYHGSVHSTANQMEKFLKTGNLW
jgi:8-oxo-dGTP pyrophosphatase MutT (NUDIX family)